MTSTLLSLDLLSGSDPRTNPERRIRHYCNDDCLIHTLKITSFPGYTSSDISSVLQERKEEYGIFLETKPNFTGWKQVGTENSYEKAERFAYDYQIINGHAWLCIARLPLDSKPFSNSGLDSMLRGITLRRSYS